MFFISACYTGTNPVGQEERTGFAPFPLAFPFSASLRWKTPPLRFGHGSDRSKGAGVFQVRKGVKGN